MTNISLFAILLQMTEVTRHWKARYKVEKELNQQLYEHLYMCEQEAYDILDNLKVPT